MKLFKVLLVLLLAFIPVCLFAQGGPTDVSDTPVDCGLVLLLASGVGYGARRLYQGVKRK